ncbi:hypothetical protein E9O_09264 [Moraxella catarrhalis 12P80B1]|nr:hypothetical protein E9O_09264 [Moraxella catarrhalis 12P80B1]
MGGWAVLFLSDLCGREESAVRRCGVRHFLSDLCGREG